MDTAKCLLCEKSLTFPAYLPNSPTDSYSTKGDKLTLNLPPTWSIWGRSFKDWDVGSFVLTPYCVDGARFYNKAAGGLCAS